jgi:hypothetical protein
MKTVKKFDEYLAEASLQGNPGIPGESGEGGKKYLSDVERRAAGDLSQTERDLGPQIGRFMSLVDQSRRLQDPYKKELEKIAKDAILSL